MRFGRYGTEREDEPKAETPKPSRLSWPYRKLAAAVRWVFTTPTYEQDTLEKIAEIGQEQIRSSIRNHKIAMHNYTFTPSEFFSDEAIEARGNYRIYKRQKKALRKISKSTKKGKTPLETLESNVDYLYNNHSDQETAARDIQNILGVESPDSDDNCHYRTPAGESYVHAVVENFAKKHNLSYSMDSITDTKKQHQKDSHVKKEPEVKKPKAEYYPSYSQVD
jgi:hypothetical protein